MIRSPFSCEEIGTWLAQADDKQQATLLNAWAKESRIACKSMEDTQYCYVSASLDDEGKRLITSLADYIKHREENPQ